MSVTKPAFVFMVFLLSCALTAGTAATPKEEKLRYCDNKTCSQLFKKFSDLKQLITHSKPRGYSVKRIVRSTDAKAQRLRGDYMMYSSYTVVPRDEVDTYRDIKSFLTDIHKQDVKLAKNFLGNSKAYFVGRDYTGRVHAFEIRDVKTLEKYLWKFQTLGFKATEYKYPRNNIERFENTVINEGAGKLRVAIPERRMLLEWTLDQGVVVYMRKKRSNKYLRQKAGIKDIKIVKGQ